MEKKFLRTLVVVDVLVPDKNMDNGGNGRSGNSGGGNGNRSNFILSPLIGDVIKKTTQACTTNGLVEEAQTIIEGEENHGIMLWGARALWGANL